MAQQPPAPIDAAAPPAAQTNGLAVAGLVLGIASAALFFFWFVAIPCGIVGIVLSIIGLGRSKTRGKGKGMAMAGLILSVLGLLAALVFAIGWLIWLWRDISRWVDQSHRDVRSVAGTWRTISACSAARMLTTRRMPW